MILQRFCFSMLLGLFSAHATHAVNVQSPPLYESVLATPGTLADRTLGARISVSGSTAAVVALADNSSSTGSVYLYDAQEDWRLITEFNSASNTDNFGQNIILQNNILIISADRDDQGAGAVYIFERLSPASPEP